MNNYVDSFVKTVLNNQTARVESGGFSYYWVTTIVPFILGWIEQ